MNPVSIDILSIEKESIFFYAFFAVR